jgi:hypothetical protein
LSASLVFPSRAWCEAAAAAMLHDPAVRAAIADFGAVVAGIVIERGGGLASDFCVLARIEPGKPVKLSYPDDEDELEELEPDYIGWAPYALCKTLLEETLAGRRPDPLRAILERKVRLKGDLERLVKHAGRHKGAGLDAIRSVPAEFV